MTKTPSKTMTADQIDNAVANYRALLERHRGDFNVDAVQTVLDQSKLASEQFRVFRRHVEAISNLIIRVVSVKRSRSMQEALNATGRVQHTYQDVVNNAPRGEGDEVELVFFKLPDLSECCNGQISDDDLEEEYELRGLYPADLNSVTDFNEADPDFADEKHHGTHWKDANGNWCHAVFGRCDDKRVVCVRYTNNSKWHVKCWWFVGIRK